MEFGFQTPLKNLKSHSAAPREISNFSVVFEPNSKFHSPQKRVCTKIMVVFIILPVDTHQPPQANSVPQQQGVQQWQISAGHSSKHFPPIRWLCWKPIYWQIIMDRVVVKLADELMSREAFTHQDVNLLLAGKRSTVQ